MTVLDQQLEVKLEQFITNALAEDVGSGDHTSQACIPADERSKAKLLVKDPGVLAGVEVARRIFHHVDPGSTVSVHLEARSARAISLLRWNAIPRPS